MSSQNTRESRRVHLASSCTELRRLEKHLRMYWGLNDQEIEEFYSLDCPIMKSDFLKKIKYRGKNENNK
jgi:hypothetical protein